jgi:Domain of unknown function (DUF5666)
MDTFNLRFRHPWKTLVKLACLAAVLTGCGGGGDSGTATSLASGPITGLGSIIVNGVRFDDSSARIASDDDDDDKGGLHHRSELKLGMVVEVQGGGITSDDTGRRGKANDIRFGSEIVGPVGTININARTLTVLGQAVLINDSTIFDNSLPAGFASLRPGDVIEVHGLFDATRTVYTATRIEPESNATSFKIRGAIAELNTTDKSFKIGNETIVYASLATTPTLANAMIVRVKVQTTKDASGRWVAIRIKNGVRKVEDHDEAEVKGSVANLAGDGRSFEIEGLKIDAANVSNLPALSNGSFVEVEGRVVGGVLVARKVELEDNHGAGTGEFEFHRKISAATPVDKTFVLDTTTIIWNDATVFEKGATQGSLTVGTCVEVKAASISGSTNLRAVRIKLDNSCTS